MSAHESNTYRWMIDQARSAGWDLNATEQVHGAQVPVHRVLRLWAALAVRGELDVQQHDHLARVFGVTEDEFRTVWQTEMREREMGELLAHPELAALDRDMDTPE